MPEWTTPETTPAERVALAHRDATGTDPVRVADAPGTWVLIGENVDHYGGVTIMGLADLRAAAAFSPRDDDTVRVTFRSPTTEDVVEETTLSELSAIGVAFSSPDDDTPEPSLSLATRFGGIIHTLMSRQMLSRDTPGMDITIVSDIPVGAGLGAFYAGDVALALALTGDDPDIDEAPMRTRLAEVCSQAIDMFSPLPGLRARHTAALRGVGETVSVVDYADGSVTQAPHPERAGVDVFSVAKRLGTPDSSQTQQVRDLRQFLDQACHNFGTESLRSIPDAVDRVVEWAEAVRQIRGGDSMPSVEQAQDWMVFSESETLRALAVAKALRSRRTDDLFHLLNSPADNYGLATPGELVELLNLRGARAARPAAAGMSQAVITFAPTPRAENFAADLADDGFYVIPIRRGECARVL